MNYYNRHIGDYAAKTGHLSIIEHGIYTLLIDAYYNRERGPTKAEAIRWSRAKSADELASLDAILDEFFVCIDGVYVQSRIEQEFEKWAAFQAKQSANGKASGRARKERKETPVEPNTNQNEPPFNDRSTKTNQSTNPLSTNPIPKEDQKTSATGVARFEEFWAGYPNKKGKAQAEKFWKRDKLDSLADQIIADVERRKSLDWDWVKDGGQYIPHGSTYVNEKRWLDEIKPLPNAPPETKPSKLAQGLEALERMKHGLVQNRNTNGITEAGFARLGVDSTDGDDSGYGRGVV